MSRRSPTPFGSLLLGPADQSRRRLRVRVQLLLSFMLVTANLVGAGAVVSLLVLVRPDVPLGTGTVLVTAVGAPAYVLFAVGVGLLWGTARSLAALRWVTERRDPTREEARVALRVPLRLTLMQALLWALAVGLFFGLELVLQPELAATTLLAVLIGGILVTATSYLLSEFALRPVAARALSVHPSLTGRRRGSSVRRRMLLFWLLGTGAPVAGLVVASILSLADPAVSKTRLAVVVLVLCGVVALVGLLITALDARAVTAPLLAVQDGLARVERGELDHRVQVWDATELGSLQSGFNTMAAGLSERDRMRDLFGRHVGHEVAEAAMAGDLELGGETRTVSVLFVDLVGSTAYAAERSPAEVVEVLNRFCAVVVDEVDRESGLVNKFMGDAVLAIFGAPVDRPDHARAALSAARSMARRLAGELPEVAAGIGVATGDAVAGNVGDERRFEYTVIGDAVNEAARLTELAKDRPGRVLASAAALRAAGEEEAARWRLEEPVVLRGRSAETELAVPAADPEEQRAQASATSSA